MWFLSNKKLKRILNKEFDRGAEHGSYLCCVSTLRSLMAMLESLASYETWDTQKLDRIKERLEQLIERLLSIKKACEKNENN